MSYRLLTRQWRRQWWERCLGRLAVPGEICVTLCLQKDSTTWPATKSAFGSFPLTSRLMSEFRSRFITWRNRGRQPHPIITSLESSLNRKTENLCVQEDKHWNQQSKEGERERENFVDSPWLHAGHFRPDVNRSLVDSRGKRAVRCSWMLPIGTNSRQWTTGCSCLAEHQESNPTPFRKPEVPEIKRVSRKMVWFSASEVVINRFGGYIQSGGSATFLLTSAKTSHHQLTQKNRGTTSRTSFPLRFCNPI